MKLAATRVDARRSPGKTNGDDDDRHHDDYTTAAFDDLSALRLLSALWAKWTYGSTGDVSDVSLRSRRADLGHLVRPVQRGAVMAANSWIGLTYIADNASVPVPPAWFLAAIHDYDAELVLLPSRTKPFAYIIARRVRGKTWDKATVDSMTNPDTKLCMAHNLVPVCMMFKHGPVWDVTPILKSLAARDLWAHGGAEKVADLLEEQEEAERTKIDADIRADLWNRSGDAWRSYQRRTGQRTSVPGANGAAHNGSSSSTTAGVTE